MKDNILVEILSKGFLYLFLQIILLSNVTLFGSGQVWVYPALIVTLPMAIPRIRLLFIAFAFGLIIDIFFNTLGIHTASLVFIAFLKQPLYGLFSSYMPSSSSTDSDILTIRSNGLSWFLLFGGTSIFIHHICFYMIDASGFSWFSYTIKRVVLSSLFSIISIVSLQYLIYPARSSR